MITVAETRESREPSVTFLIKVATSLVLRLQGGKQSFVDSFASSSLLSSDQLLKWVAW